MEGEPDESWQVIHEPFRCGKAQGVPAWIASLLYADGINVVSQ
jgi:hypothetical protein